MKSNSKMLLQNVQDTYSANLKMTLYMTDREGNPITNMSGIIPFVELLVYQTQVPFLHQLKKIISEYSSFRTCVSFDPFECPFHCDIKALLVPVIVSDEIVSYIWCWSYLEEGISESQKAGIDLHEANKEWIDPVFQLPVLSYEQLLEKKVQLENMANICAELLKSNRESGQLNEVEQIVDALKTSNLQYYEILEIIKRDKNFDYIGFASLKEETVKIKSYIGPNEESIVGGSLEKSGTFFEDVTASKNFEYLEDIGFDPRLSFLMKNGIKTGSFFCYPVLINDEVAAFLFGGKKDGSSFSTNTLQRIRILAKIIELGMHNEWVKSSIDLHLMKLSILMEISKSMATINNLQDILLMIANIANSLVPGHFTCVNTKSGHYEFLNITYKLDEAAINEYCKEVRLHYFNSEKKVSIQTARMIEKYETVIMECPIFMEDTLYGIISVSLQQPNKIKEAEVYLTSLTSISSIALAPFLRELRYKQIKIPENVIFESQPVVGNLTARELDVLKLIVKGMSNKEIGDVLYISPHTVKNHITNIFNKLGVNDRTQIIATFYELNYKK